MVDISEKQNLINAYELDNTSVERRFRDHSWLTQKVIEEVKKNEKDPEREDDFGPFKDSYLADFAKLEVTDEPYPVIARGFMNFLTQNCSTEQGHFIPLNYIEGIWDKDLEKYAKKLGFNPEGYYGVGIDRAYLWDLPRFVSILSAPEQLRRQLVKLFLHRNGKEIQNDVFMLTAFVKKALDVYMQKWDSKQTILENE